MADQVMRASTEMAAIVPEIWSARFYDRLLSELPFMSLVSRDYEGEIQDLGDTVNISTVEEFDQGTELAEDGRADAEATSVTGQQLVINKRVVKDYIVTKRAQIQSLPHMDKLRELAIHAIMRKIQSNIVTDTVPSASAPDHQIAYDSGSTLALADILEAKELLDAQDVPLDNLRWAVLATAQMNDIFNISGFTSSDFLLAATAGAPLARGQVPPLVGFEVRMSTELDSSTTSYWFHSDYFTLAIQKQLSVDVFDLGVDGKRATRVNVDVLYGQKQLDDTRVVTIS